MPNIWRQQPSRRITSSNLIRKTITEDAAALIAGQFFEAGGAVELLIRIVDRGGVDRSPGISDSKAGDVIAICPEGWVWSVEERTAPYWRIVRVPLTKVECDALLATGVGDPRLQPVWKRKYKINALALPVAAQQLLAASRSGDGVIDFTSRLTAVRTATLLKAPRT